MRELLAIGYEKVVFNTALIRDPSLIQNAADYFGKQSIVASIDAKKSNGEYLCAIADGTELIKRSPVDLAKEAERLGAGEIIINSIDQDGMMNGYDLDLVRSVSNAVTVPVTAVGGARGIRDLKTVLEEGHAHAAAGGSMFVYYGRLKAVLITAPTEKELLAAGVYSEDI